MDYKKIYEALIKSKKALNRSKNSNEYFERHHILPKCLGGNNLKENIVLLTFKEHLFAHRLLAKIHSGKNRAKMCFALHYLLVRNKNPKELEKNRVEYSKLLSEHKAFLKKDLLHKIKKMYDEGYTFQKIADEFKVNTQSVSTFFKKHKILARPKGMIGKKHNDQAILKMSISHSGEKNHNYGKSTWNKGLTVELWHTSKKIEQLDFDNNLIKIWPSIKEIQTVLGFSKGNICSCCKGNGRSQANGYKWRYSK